MLVEVVKLKTLRDNYLTPIMNHEDVDASYIGELLAIVAAQGRVCYVIADSDGFIHEEFIGENTKIRKGE